MNCKDLQGMLTEYIERELGPAEERELMAHARTCPRCGEEIAAAKRYRDALAALPQHKAPADLLANIHRRLETGSEPLAPRIARRLFFPLRIKLPLEAAGALAIALLAIIWLRPGGGLDEAMESTEQPSSMAFDKSAKEAPPAAYKKIASSATTAHGTRATGSRPLARRADRLEKSADDEAPVTYKKSPLAYDKDAGPAAAEEMRNAAPPEMDTGKQVIILSLNESPLDTAVAESARTRAEGFIEKKAERASPAQKPAAESRTLAVRRIALKNSAVILAENAPGVASAEAGSLVIELPTENYDRFMNDLEQLGSVRLQVQAQEKADEPQAQAPVRRSKSAVQRQKNQTLEIQVLDEAR